MCAQYIGIRGAILHKTPLLAEDCLKRRTSVDGRIDRFATNCEGALFVSWNSAWSDRARRQELPSGD